MKIGELYRHRRSGRHARIVDICRWSAPDREDGTPGLKHELVLYRYTEPARRSRGRGLIVGRRANTYANVPRFLHNFELTSGSIRP